MTVAEWHAASIGRMLAIHDRRRPSAWRLLAYWRWRRTRHQIAAGRCIVFDGPVILEAAGGHDDDA